MFFRVFQGFLTLNSDDGPPRRPFHSLVLVKGGVVFSNFKGRIVFGDPLASNSDPPLRGKVCFPKHPK